MSTRRELERRIEELERQRLIDQHVHRWQLSKTWVLTPGGSVVPYVMWSWKCIADDTWHGAKVCPQPSGGTNARGMLPEFWPEELR